jgi:hypothetical protein
MATFLPSDSSYRPASFTLPDGGQASLIRLVSLQSWSFKSVDPLESFEGYLTNVDTGPMQRSAPLVLDPPSDEGSDGDPNRVVAAAFGLGYTAINHETRQGDTTVSWYRGPFIPFDAPGAIFIPPPDPDTNLPSNLIYTADQLVRYDPNNGLLDVSYAAAWEIGRLLALQNKSFSIALYNWKRSLQHATAMTLMRAAMAEHFSGFSSVLSGQAATCGEIQKAAMEFVRLRLKSALDSVGSEEGR